MTSSRSRFSRQARHTVGRLLKHILAEESQLAAASRNYAWRVPGSPLQSLKRLISEQGRQIDQWLGTLAEQARAIGVTELAPVEDDPQRSAVADADSRRGARPAIAELLARHERLAKELRVAVDAECRRDLTRRAEAILEQLAEFHETAAWMLRLLLESPEPARV